MPWMAGTYSSLVCFATLACGVLKACNARGTSADDSNCFVTLATPLSSPPFDDAATKLMASYFMDNINVNGTGAVIASPGDTPALPPNVLGGYRFHWTRDGALSLMALQRMGSMGQFGVSSDFVKSSMESYIHWVMRIESLPHVNAHTEPKWNIMAGHPYSLPWCRPQTDGPPLRALNLMMYADSSWQRKKLWPLIKFDLDWLVQPDNINMPSCDVWEEGTEERNLLWNRLAMQAALIKGADFADSVGDDSTKKSLEAAILVIGDIIVQHRKPESSGGWITECPISNPSDNCESSGKEVDGIVFAGLIHTAWLSGDTQLPGSSARAPTSIAVANTVQHFNSVFCAAYPINREDSAAGKPGVLYGRYAADQYAGGNPWVLLTAVLASALYQAAQHVTKGSALTAAELSAWKAALRADGFTGAPDDFVAAGDAVLLRLKEHVAEDDHWHLYEQIDKTSGKQYNAKDLTWSYAEVLTALLERKTALDTLEPVFIS